LSKKSFRNDESQNNYVNDENNKNAMNINTSFSNSISNMTIEKRNFKKPLEVKRMSTDYNAYMSNFKQNVNESTRNYECSPLAKVENIKKENSVNFDFLRLVNLDNN